MLITRTPLRISLGGGGTDLPSYYSRFGATVIAAAITKYIYIGINRTFTANYSIKYSEMELVDTAAEIRHPLIREAFVAHGLQPGIELVSLADIPDGTGLGSSGTFTVGLLRAIYALQRSHVATAALAEEAWDIEMNRLGRAVGKQDQYIAALGGVTCLELTPDGEVTASPLKISTATLNDLDEHLLLFFTGYSRRSVTILEDQNKRTLEGDESMVKNLQEIARIGKEVKEALVAGDTSAFGRLLDVHWKQKRTRSAGMSSSNIDAWYEAGIASGALGGKLVGAGAGGFLMFYSTRTRELREAMAGLGLAELRFSFDHDGSTVVIRD
jgi:D-glycero-alpha-D-manno-heptose-7-phosphate kinase